MQCCWLFDKSKDIAYLGFKISDNLYNLLWYKAAIFVTIFGPTVVYKLHVL